MSGVYRKRPHPRTPRQFSPSLYGDGKQFLRPDSDISVGGWTPTPGTPTTLFDKIDEVIASDTDYISEL